MKFDRVKEIIELVAVFSIVASLIFVGVQIRQEREIAGTVSVANAAEGRKQLAELINENSKVWVDGLAGKPLSDYDVARFRALAEAHRLDRYASWYRASRLNHVSADRFAAQYAIELLESPGLHQFWREHTKRETAIRQSAGQDDAEFETLVDQYLKHLSQSASEN